MKALLQRVGLVLFGLAVAWLIVEAFARFAGLAEPLQLGTDFDRSPTLFAPEPERQHPWSQGTDDRLAIAAIGDSFTVGAGVQPDDSYPARLERLLNLNADVTPAEVRIYARGGTSTSYQVGFLKRAVAEQPDLVLLGIFLNDTENYDVGEWREKLLPRVPAGWKLELLRASHSLAWIYQRLEAARIQRVWVDYLQALYDPDFPGWERFNRALGVFARTCRGAGIPLVAIVLLSPSALEPEYPFEFAHQRIHWALDQQEIPFLDLLETFRGRSGQRLTVLPGVDGHLNEIGNRIVAEAVFDYLLEAGHIPADYRPRLATPQPREDWLERLRSARSVFPNSTTGE